MRTDCGVADLAFQLRPGNERRDRINHDYIESVRAYQSFANPQGFLAGAWLRHQQIVQIHAQPLGVCRIERVLHVNKGGESAALLSLRNHRQRKRGFSGRFRAENFHHPAPWKAAYAKGAIDQNVARGNDINIDNFFIAKTHDGALAIVLRYLLNREVEVFVSRRSHFISGCFFFGLCCHTRCL